jgi:hypothetical protein
VCESVRTLVCDRGRLSTIHFHKVSISTSLPLIIHGSERCEALLGSSVIGADGGGWGEGRGPSDPLDCSFGIAGEEGLNAPAR